MREYFVYIMSSHRRTLYTGVTNDLARRVRQHKDGSVAGFTSKYKIDQVVYAESCGNIEDALNREKQIDLIMTLNPGWSDLTKYWGLPGDETGQIPTAAA